MAELVVNELDSKCFRFQCECGDPSHCMDIWINSQDGIATVFTFYNVFLAKPKSVFLRILCSAKYVLGLPLVNHSFHLKKEDLQDLINYLNSTKVVDIISMITGAR
jgi:hypothetical protein